jgi:hypothetical protein
MLLSKHLNTVFKASDSEIHCEQTTLKVSRKTSNLPV